MAIALIFLLAFENLQVLQRDISNEQLLSVMHFMRSSLGVRCEYCHVAENGKYKLDDKKTKLRAREMIVMTRKLNEASFGGQNVVTCETCHHGAPIPASVPEIRANFVNTTRREPDEPAPPALPSASEILARFEAATHIGSLSAVRITVNGCRGKIVDRGTPRARVIPRADCSMQEVVLKDFGEVRELRVRAADFSSIAVEGIEDDMYRLVATGKDGVAQKLWFSKATGLLVRRTFYHPIALGLDPEQFDLSEYKRFGAVTLPARINVSHLDDQHLGILKTILSVEPQGPD